MRILHLDAGRAMRGGQWQVLRLVQALVRQGVKCTLLARRGSPLFARASQVGLDTQSLSWWNTAMCARSADLVHAHDARSHTVAALAGGAPLVVSRRVAFPVRSAWKYRRAAHYIAVSEFVKGVLLDANVPESRISVVYDGVELSAEAARGDCIVAPASDDPRKGTALAREAARRAGVEIVFSNDLQTDLLRARLFVYLTHSEGLGSGVLLAMAAGVPVVASHVGGLPEIVRHGRTGLLVENTPEAVLQAMNQLLRDPVLAQRFGEEGRRLARDRFSVDHMSQGTLAVYRQVLGC